MRNIFNWAKRKPESGLSHPDEKSLENVGPADEIPIPDIYQEPTGDTAKLPKLRNVNQSSDSDDEGFDPYDTAVLVEE